MLTYIIDNIIVITSSLLSGTLGIKLFEYYLKNSKNKYTEDFFNDTKQIINIIENILTNKDIDRVLLFRGGNGGSTPKVGKDFYIKAIFEGHREPPPISLLKIYDSIIPDSFYISMLLDLTQQKNIFLDVSKLPNCLLKQIYDSEGIKYVEIFLICQTKEYIFYGSVACKKHDFSNVATKLFVESNINKIRKIFEKHYNSIWFK